MKVLQVEDNLNIRESLEYSFSTNKINLVSKSNVNDTVEYLEQNKVDIIILDVTLPDGNGFDLYKKYIQKKDIPTIFLTANDAEEDIVKAFEMGANDYITKPFRTLELIARLNRILNKKIINIKDISFDMNKILEDNKGELKLQQECLGKLPDDYNKAYVLNFFGNFLELNFLNKIFIIIAKFFSTVNSLI